jgi:TfoX/Sxy family transcriptional regulator of competence genes
MPYDENLAQRVRQLLKRRKRFSERKMFGGICFMLGGNMCCGITERELMLRLGPERAEQALCEPHTREMDFTGRPMKGMIYVEPEGFREEDDLKFWVRLAADFAGSLPPKQK